MDYDPTNSTEHQFHDGTETEISALKNPEEFLPRTVKVGSVIEVVWCYANKDNYGEKVTHRKLCVVESYVDSVPFGCVRVTTGSALYKIIAGKVASPELSYPIGKDLLVSVVKFYEDQESSGLH